MTEAYPLQWPHGRPRARGRKVATFSSGGTTITLAAAVKRLRAELERLGAVNPVINSNLRVRLDGSPILNQAAPPDPGVVVFFSLKGKPVAMPCDTYTTIAGNMAAIAEHIKATRMIARYGVATMSEMYAGFAALPAPDGADWWEVLKLPRTASRDDIEAAFRTLARERHPDRGGSDHQMAELNAARAKALRDIGTSS
jgi:hypothetical protein